MLKTEEDYQKELARLKDIIGSWRRKAQDKGPRREFVREGYDLYHASHYKVYAVQDIPGDLPMEEVLKELKHSFLPTVLPYEFDRCDYSNKYKGWMVQVSRTLLMNMRMVD